MEVTVFKEWEIPYWLFWKNKRSPALGFFLLQSLPSGTCEKKGLMHLESVLLTGLFKVKTIAVLQQNHLPGAGGMER